jgi:hypothetical protein
MVALPANLLPPAARLVLPASALVFWLGMIAEQQKSVMRISTALLFWLTSGRVAVIVEVARPERWDRVMAVNHVAHETSSAMLRLTGDTGQAVAYTASGRVCEKPAPVGKVLFSLSPITTRNTRILGR